MANASYLENVFKTLDKEGALSQGYIFFGNDSGGEKAEFSESLANFLENKKWEISGKILLDVQIIDVKKDVGIDLVRAASDFLWQKPVASERRTLIIKGADSMTDQAQNAILKIAEEPPAHSLIILILKDPSSLFPAVVSRFQKIFFPSTGKEKIVVADSALIFLKAPAAKRKDIIKEVIDEAQEKEDNKIVEEFVVGIITELNKDIKKNWPVLKKLLQRWTAMNDYNTNRRLQLEAALL